MTKQSCLISRIILSLCLITTCRGYSDRRLGTYCWGWEPHSTADCPHGQHFHRQSDICNDCVSNENGCSNYDYTNGICIECSGMYNLNISVNNGNHCIIKWWVVFLIVLAGIAACFLCFCVYGMIKKYKQKKKHQQSNHSNNNT